MQQFCLGSIESQYQSALDAGTAIDSVLKSRGLKLHILGHSLGGGIASYVALATNNTCTTINAVGLSKFTLWNSDNQFKLINSYYLSGDLLSWAEGQSIAFSWLMPNAIGNRIQIAPPFLPLTGNSTMSQMYNTPGILSWRVEMHFMDSVLQTIDYHKGKK